MRSAYFAMALHLHQPVGNFDSVFERAYKNCYSPFINLLYRYPDIKIALHISGCLIDYLETNHREFLDKLNEMSTRNQIEFLGGAYYEPILIAIPHRDLSGQIKMMSRYIRSRFHRDPTGMWVPERVWMPWLVTPITVSGIKYCILDDTHLLKAGVAKEKMYGYFLAKDGEKRLAVFPSDKRLRYNIPFGKPSDVISYFSEVAGKQKNPLFVYGDDGEKFGEWPGTYKWVFEDGWLKSFFEELRKNSGWLKLLHFSDYMNSNQPLGEFEIPEASYDEMIEWTDGSWLNFLRKYPETNHMHKKMCYVSHKIDNVMISKGENSILEQAIRYLYKGQCNCAYWHGVFGGLYLYHLRNAVYSNLIEAEKIVDGIIHADEKWIEVKSFDMNSDGKEEIIMENPSFSLYINPEEGGVLKELDYRPLSVNLINTLSRRKESYHQKILETVNKRDDDKTVHTIHEDIKSANIPLGQKLIYDQYPRYCLRDHFISDKVEREPFMDGSFEELGDFTEGIYKAGLKDDSVILERIGIIAREKVKLTKEIVIESKNKLKVLYCIEKESQRHLNVLLGIEFNITMPFLNSKQYNYVSDGKKLGGLDEDGEIKNITSFGIIDANKGLDIKFKFSNGVRNIWFFPVKTLSQSERTYELNFQCSCIVPVWKLNFDKNNICRLEINILIDTKKKWYNKNYLTNK